MIFADYHTHTALSHGEGCVADLAEAARARGLTALAVSEHGPGNVFFGLNAEKRARLAAECRAADSPELRVMAGLECNLTGYGRTDAPKNEKWDILLLGYHKGVLPRDAFALRAAMELIGLGRSAAYNTAALTAALDTADFFAVSHPGLYIPLDIPELARRCAERNVYLEINASSMPMTADGLRRAADAGARFIISSDAHTPSRVGDVGRAVALAAEAGVLALVMNYAPDGAQ